MRAHYSTGKTSRFAGIAILCLCALPVHAQNSPVTVQVEISDSQSARKASAKSDASDSSNVVVWLTPMDATFGSVPGSARTMPQIVQKNKNFEPRILVIQTGTPVQFPNKDPFLHNVFSLFNGKQFDLGFYEAGSSKTVHFDRSGVSFLFCNIHPEMSAVVISVPTPYFGLSDHAGHVSIPNVPDGHYQMNVWYERSLPQELNNLSRAVTISGSTRSLEPIRMTENPNFSLNHKNKYGQDYIPAANISPGYHP